MSEQIQNGITKKTQLYPGQRRVLCILKCGNGVTAKTEPGNPGTFIQQSLVQHTHFFIHHLSLL